MKTTVIANISGVAFQIDDDAYILLEKYLKNLAIKLGNSDEGKETVSDIEGRIAELFSRTHKADVQSISLDEVEEIIRTIGEIDSFDGPTPSDSNSNPEAQAAQATTNQPKPSSSKKLFRDVDNRFLGGVCSGLGSYFEIDPLVIRILLLILMAVGAPFIFIGYVVMWLAVPAARTFAQKIEMVGGINEQFDKQDEMAYQRRYSRSDGWFTKTVRTVVGVWVILMGVPFSIVSFVLLISAFSMNAVAPHLHFIPFYGAFDIFSEHLFGGTSLFVILLGVSFWFIAPAILLIYGGVKILKTSPYKIKFLVPACILLWIFGWVMVISAAVGVSKEFEKKSEVASIISINPTSSTTIYLKANAMDSVEEESQNYTFSHSTISIPKNLSIGTPNIWLERGDSLKVVVKRGSRGLDSFAAISNAKSSELNVSQNDSVINLDPKFIIPQSAKWRSQKVDVVITVPQGKQLIIDPKLQDLVQNKLY